MNESRFSATQIISSLRLLSMGRSCYEICLRGGFPAATLLQWQHKYAGLNVDELLNLRALEWEMRGATPLPQSLRIRENHAELVLDTARCVRCTVRPTRHENAYRSQPMQTCRHHCRHG